jgi:hypothetical protein
MAKFESVKGPLDHLLALETHNEADAHSLAAWLINWPDGGNENAKRKAFQEVDQQLVRMKTESHWPEGATWVSQGGGDGQGTELFDYDWRKADAIAFHPSRPSMRIGDRFNHLLNKPKPVYANEIIHYIDPAFWWTVEKGWFRPASSTQNASLRMEFVRGMQELGFWVCDHSLVGMANGMFKNGNTWEEMPLDGFEKMLDGDSMPPPTQPETYPFKRIIAMAYQDIFGREPDASGLRHYN